MPRPTFNHHNRKRHPSLSGDANSHKNRATIISKWDIPKPIILQIISWLDQDSLMNMSVVSKQLYNAICTEPGNENKISPVFVVRWKSIQKLVNNFRNYFLNEKTKAKLKKYRIMRLNVPDSRFMIDDDVSTNELNSLKLILKNNNIEMSGITSLEFISSWSFIGGSARVPNKLPCILRIILPNLTGMDFSNTLDYKSGIFRDLFLCPLLNKVISNNNDDGVDLNGSGMKLIKNLTEIQMNNTIFRCMPYHTKYKFSSSNIHPEVFIFHECCKYLERVSVRNMKFPHSTVNEDERFIFNQNALIKFVRNAPSLRWLQSDLSRENIAMLQEERSRLGKREIELLSNPTIINLID
jgi:hypothetical protein